MKQMDLKYSTKKVFEACAALYLREDKHWGCDLDIIARYVEKFEDAAVMELGTGYAWHLANLFFVVSTNLERVTGVDYSRSMLAQARKLLKSITLDTTSLLELIELEEADILCLPFEDGSFDVALILNNTLGNLPGEDFGEAKKVRKKALREVKRILQPEGYLILSVYNAERLTEEDKYGEVFELDHELSSIESFDLVVEFKKTGERYYSHWFRKDELSTLLYDTNFKVELMEERAKRIVVVAKPKRR